MIIEDLEGDSSTLANLCSTSSRFFRVVKSTLYRTIKVELSQCNRLLNLVRTLLYRPEYALMVRSLDVSACFKTGINYALDPPQLVRHRLNYQITLEGGPSYLRFLRDCAHRIKASEHKDKDASVLVSSRWTSSIMHRESPAFATLLTALCPSLQHLVFLANSEAPNLEALPAMFGFTYGTEDQQYDLDVDIKRHINGLFPGLSLHMPKVAHLSTHLCNMEMLLLGFESLKTLELDFTTSGEGYRSSIATFTSPVEMLPSVQNMVFRIDWEELDLYIPRAGIYHWFQLVKMPRLATVTVILKVSPREQDYFDSPYAGFQMLIEKLETRHYSAAPDAPTPLASIRELKILASDEGKFDSRFLDNLQPFVDLCYLPRLEQLTVPWRAIQSGYFNESPQRTCILPESLKTLRIVSPDGDAPSKLRHLFREWPHHRGQLQTIELLFDEGQLQTFKLLFGERWYVQDSLVPKHWQTTLDSIPARFTSRTMGSVSDEIKSLTTLAEA